jgi:F5/8 type C domain-containing protein
MLSVLLNELDHVKRMKYCPQCKRTYSDDSLRFCLDDGTVLARDPNATLPYGPTTYDAVPPTEVFRSPAPPARQTATISSTLRTESPSGTGATARSSNPILTAGVISIAVLLLILTAVGAAFVYKYRKGSDSVGSPRAGSSTPTPLPESANANSGRQASGELQIRASASSVRYAVQTNTYDAANAIDGNKRTAWIEGVDGAGIGEWLRFDFGREIILHRVFILPGYFKSPQIWAQNNRIAGATLQFSDGSSNHFTFPDRMERQTLDVGAIKTRWVRLVIDNVFSGTDPDTAISEVTFEWEP